MIQAVSLIFRVACIIGLFLELKLWNGCIRAASCLKKHQGGSRHSGHDLILSFVSWLSFNSLSFLNPVCKLSQRLRCCFRVNGGSVLTDSVVLEDDQHRADSVRRLAAFYEPELLREMLI